MMKLTLKLCLLIPLLGLATHTHAECTRADIDYFLKKGFTHPQVTSLCKDASDASNTPPQRYKSYDDEVQKRIEKAEAYEDEQDEKRLLQFAVKGKNVRITPDYLSYIHTICISIGNGPERASRLKICPEIRYRLYFKGLKVKGTQRKYFVVGQREIEVAGNIKRKLLNDFKDYDSSTRKTLLSVWRQRVAQGSTFIPIRKDYPLHQVTEVLRRYIEDAASNS